MKQIADDLHFIGELHPESEIEILDEFGLPVRNYGSNDSALAEKILKRYCLEIAAKWCESYLDCLKDRPKAIEHGISHIERILRYLSQKSFEIAKLVRAASKESQVEFGNTLLIYF